MRRISSQEVLGQSCKRMCGVGGIQNPLQLRGSRILGPYLKLRHPPAHTDRREEKGMSRLGSLRQWLNSVEVVVGGCNSN